MKYPLGVQDFTKIIKRGALYVDKTALIHEMIEQNEMVFLSRPRRFGKSVLISTMAALFSGQKALFDGLAISETDYDFAEHPVIEFSFSRVDVNQAADLQQYIINTTNAYARRLDIALTVESYEQRFAELIEKLPDDAVLLIDEYDKPILDNLLKPALAEIKQVMSAFYSTVKGLDRYLRFVFITGVSKFAKVSVFSAMNNLVNISTDKYFATICGVTQTELEHNFDAAIDELVQSEKSDRTSVLSKIKQWYNGYRFHPDADGVYNPFSLLSLFKFQDFKYYWFDTGAPTFLIELIKSRQFDLSKVVTMEVDEGAFMSHEPEKMHPLPVLLQTGYLTIATYVDGWYTLDFPNFEVKQAFNRAIVEQFAHTDDFKNAGYIRDLCRALNEDDIQSFIEILQTFFANIPYDITLKHEHYYQSLFFAIFTLLGFQLTAEVRTNKGRIDCVLQTDTTIYVIEFKLNDTCEAAIKQIQDKQYAQKYQNSEKAVVLLGVAFDKDTRNIGGYLRVEVEVEVKV
jgi:hypothetical protein